MSLKKDKVDKDTNLKDLKPELQMKYEIAKELGLFDRVLENGWKNLSAKETGRIGGLMTKRKKEMKEAENKAAESKAVGLETNRDKIS
ncbi:small, acid-soluble spore protein, alpha/beta type [Anaeromicropila herbilytica]|uniref:Small, acid-soluble spore protein, alpha/beta type n=1 Tax=Anaeromicropila herbilytica TaxID=2785025 RepID=A0A7R7IEI7_9FIRM|nr:small, acid-soluble spore protein, alpha/beta type [Anaeromicropila herbilytica]BCN32149.1 hypothetical protein bsdtb5_34440 [Anaeromicropila herbilytica]